jgi:acetyltransferase-like isoleucine patch superfamily enzyme
VERDAWEKEEPVLTIGDRVGMRMGCTVTAAESVTIEQDVVMGAHVTITDSRHTWDSGEVNTLKSALRTAPVRVGRGTWLADGVTVTAGATIGEQCVVGSNAVVRGDIPSHSMVVGNPGEIVGSTGA